MTYTAPQNNEHRSTSMHVALPTCTWTANCLACRLLYLAVCVVHMVRTLHLLADSLLLLLLLLLTLPAGLIGFVRTP